MTTKYQVTDSRGQVHKRTTMNRTYTHAVVCHMPEMPDRYHPDKPWPARSSASWCGRADLAEKEAARWRKHGYPVEIIPIDPPFQYDPNKMFPFGSRHRMTD